MQITITPTGLPAFLIGDDTIGQILTVSWPAGAGGAIKEGLLNKQRRMVDRVALFRAAYQIEIARFNASNAFSCTVQRTFTTIPLCLLFIATHPDTTPASGEITIAEGGTNICYSPNAIVDSVECIKQVGCSCDFSYAFSLNGPWQLTP